MNVVREMGANVYTVYIFEELAVTFWIGRFTLTLALWNSLILLYMHQMLRERFTLCERSHLFALDKGHLENLHNKLKVVGTQAMKVPMIKVKQLLINLYFRGRSLKEC